MFHVGFSFHSRIVAEAQIHGQSLLRTPHSMFRETSKPLWASEKCLITSQLSKPSYFPSQHKPFCSPVGLQFNQSFAHQETVSSKQSRTMRKRWRVKEGRQEAVHNDRLAGLLPFSEVRLCWLSGWQLNPRRPSQEAAHWARHRRCGGPRRAETSTRSSSRSWTSHFRGLCRVSPPGVWTSCHRTPPMHPCSPRVWRATLKSSCLSVLSKETVVTTRRGNLAWGNEVKPKHPSPEWAHSNFSTQGSATFINVYKLQLWVLDLHLTGSHRRKPLSLILFFLSPTSEMPAKRKGGANAPFTHCPSRA